MNTQDILVVGAGVIGCSVAFHLAKLGAARVTVIDRGQIGSGTTAQSSGLLRTHYSVPENVALARASWAVFTNFADYLGDEEASAGVVACGYLAAASAGDRALALQTVLERQQSMGIEARVIDRQEAAERLPIARFDDAALIGFEPEAGFADAWMVASGFARAARRLGVRFLEGVAAEGLLREGNRVVGVRTSRGELHAGTVISTQNIWACEIERWTGIRIPLVAERHRVLALQGPEAYTQQMPVFKDLLSAHMLYCRSYGGVQMLVGDGISGERLAEPDNQPGEISMDDVVAIGEAVADRFPSYSQAELASSWTGVYDVTPDWNPVLEASSDLPGLVMAFGFSGHGFKLSPAIGKLLAQTALGLPTEHRLQPYSLERFRGGRLLTGLYGAGAVS